MYRVQKSLGNNAVLAVEMGTNRKFLIIGKGVGFGKKVTERFETKPTDTAYWLQSPESKVDMEHVAKSVAPEFLEISNYVLNEAENQFGKVDHNILFPMADHIAFAVERLKKGETIHNPMIQDIKLLFSQEFEIASMISPIIKKQFEVEMNEDEIGYVTLHIHAALTDESASEAATLAQAVGVCVEIIQKHTGCKMNPKSFSYNRLMNHIRYMMLRMYHGEHLEVDMNDYMEKNSKEIFLLSKKICEEIEANFCCKLEPAETGYLAIHIQRVQAELQI